MDIRPLKVTVREVVAGYEDNSDREEGIHGYGGRLDIRPKYQRNYIYDDAKRNAVIDTVSKDFPLGIMYWVKNEDGNYEILDGQQRTISLCTFVSLDNPARGYSIPGLFGNPHSRTFSQLLPKEKERILDYQLLVYVCEGADTDRLRWFETINIAGERLSGQEIRNAQYSGPWVTDLKRYFSRTNSPAQRLAASKPQIYITLPASNTWNRQGGLEKALRWFIGDLRDTEKLEAFMSAHKEDADAAPVWQYFQDVIAWTKRLFPTYRKGMEKVEWGILYNQYHEREFDLDAIQRRVAELYADDEVKDKSGIYEYIFDGRQSHLNLRQFEDWQRETMYERQKGRCPECVKEGVKRTYDIAEMHADHIKPWHLGGKTEIENGRMLCAAHNLAKGGEWTVRGMPDGGGMNWPGDIAFVVVGILCLAFLGCNQERQRQEFVNKDELRPTTFQELVAMNHEQIERVDIGRMNLICANEAVPGSNIGVDKLLEMLDSWADRCRREEVRFRRSFEKNPKRYDGSYAKFKAINLVLTLKEDFKCRYQMKLVESGVMADIHSPAFFKNRNDVFISGLLRSRRGTCSSYPVLIAALGRRLGYPISLKTTPGHMFCEWNDGVERFNIDTNGEGVDTPPDEHYLKSRVDGMVGMSAAEREREYFMQPLSNWECLGMFIETMGYCHEANGRMDKAIEAYNLARRYLPNSGNLKRLAARRVMPKEAFDQIQETLRFNEEQRRRLSGTTNKGVK